MPWCPKCVIEYRDGFATCNDCGTTLVDDLDDVPDKVRNETKYSKERACDINKTGLEILQDLFKR